MSKVSLADWIWNVITSAADMSPICWAAHPAKDPENRGKSIYELYMDGE